MFRNNDQEVSTTTVVQTKRRNASGRRQAAAAAAAAVARLRFTTRPTRSPRDLERLTRTVFSLKHAANAEASAGYLNPFLMGPRRVDSTIAHTTQLAKLEFISPWSSSAWRVTRTSSASWETRMRTETAGCRRRCPCSWRHHRPPPPQLLILRWEPGGAPGHRPKR